MTGYYAMRQPTREKETPVANRQQRRHPEAARELDMGEIMTRLPQPELASELTVLEANEVKARNDELTWLGDEAKDAQARLQHLSRLATIAANEKTQQIRAICLRHDLDVDRNDYELDTDRGAIMLVGTLQKAAPQLVEGRPVEEPNGAEAPVEEPVN